MQIQSPKSHITDLRARSAVSAVSRVSGVSRVSDVSDVSVVRVVRDVSGVFRNARSLGKMKHRPALRSFEFARKVGRIHDIGRRRCMRTVQMAVVFGSFSAEQQLHIKPVTTLESKQIWRILCKKDLESWQLWPSAARFLSVRRTSPHRDAATARAAAAIRAAESRPGPGSNSNAATENLGANRNGATGSLASSSVGAMLNRVGNRNGAIESHVSNSVGATPNRAGNRNGATGNQEDAAMNVGVRHVKKTARPTGQTATTNGRQKTVSGEKRAATERTMKRPSVDMKRSIAKR